MVLREAEATSLLTDEPSNALATVERLSTLFDDPPLTNLEEHLAYLYGLCGKE